MCNSGNLVLDLLYNLMLESTGRLQKCRIYEMTENKSARSSEASKLYRGASPSDDGTELSTDVMPDGFPTTISPERREEFSPGLDADLVALIQATAEVEMKEADNSKESTPKKSMK